MHYLGGVLGPLQKFWSFYVFWAMVIFLCVISALNILLCNVCRRQVVIYHLYVIVQKVRNNLFHYSSTAEVDVPDETQFCQGFSSPSLILAAQTISLYPSQASCPCFHPSVGFLLVFDFVQELIHAGLLVFLPGCFFWDASLLSLEEVILE